MLLRSQLKDTIKTACNESLIVVASFVSVVFVQGPVFVSCALHKGLCETDKSVSCPQH